jgi:hypothetical protein
MHLLCVREKLEGTTVLSDSEVTQKPRDSLLLIGTRVLYCVWKHWDMEELSCPTIPCSVATINIANGQ